MDLNKEKEKIIKEKKVLCRYNQFSVFGYVCKMSQAALWVECWQI